MNRRRKALVSAAIALPLVVVAVLASNPLTGIFNIADIVGVAGFLVLLLADGDATASDKPTAGPHADRTCHF